MRLKHLNPYLEQKIYYYFLKLLSRKSSALKFRLQINLNQIFLRMTYNRSLHLKLDHLLEPNQLGPSFPEDLQSSFYYYHLSNYMKDHLPFDFYQNLIRNTAV